VDEGIVERGEDTGNAENELACTRLLVSSMRRIRITSKHTISGQRTERDVLLGGSGGLLGRHFGCAGRGMEYGAREEEKIKIR
jgi:hypothetical protein